jgi:hypothetical protein
VEHDDSAWSKRNAELAYLANTLVAGCSIQARRFSPQEASDAVIAACNLGLENWPPHWTAAPLPDDFLVNHDLVTAFQVGWTVLHREVGFYAAGRLSEILRELRSIDATTQRDLDMLVIQLMRWQKAGAPWRAQQALDVLAGLDTPAWAALVAMIDECPTLHAVVAATRDGQTRTVRASAFEFIAENSQIAAVRAFMEALPEALRAVNSYGSDV